jgi:Ethanolamine utilization protein EutJ (predicted chaperonin)
MPLKMRMMPIMPKIVLNIMLTNGMKPKHSIIEPTAAKILLDIKVSFI